MPPANWFDATSGPRKSADGSFWRPSVSVPYGVAAPTHAARPNMRPFWPSVPAVPLKPFSSWKMAA